MSEQENILMEPIPAYVQMPETLTLVSSGMIDSRYLNVLKKISSVKDEVISSWLNINVKTFRSYKKSSLELSPDVQEHTVMLLSLMKHGIDVFGSKEAFSQWIERENISLDGSSPSGYLNTVSGIKFIDDRLSGMEYGDNA